jgi:hypothetical protein
MAITATAEETRDAEQFSIPQEAKPDKGPRATPFGKIKANGPTTPQDTPSIVDALGGELPKALEPFRDLLQRAVDKTLPMRLQKWQSRTKKVKSKDGAMVPLSSDNYQDNQNYQDPNALLYYAANAFLLLREQGRTEGVTPALRQEIDTHLTIIEGWHFILAPILRAEKPYRDALAAYEGAAPIRFVE